MIPLGIIASAYKPAELPTGQPLTGTFLQSAGDPADGATTTFVAQSAGADDPTRFIVAVVTARKGSPGATLNAVTIGGVSATIAAQVTLDGNTVGIAYAHVPVGAAVDVVVSWSTAVLRCGLGLWHITGGAVAVTTNTASSASTVASAVVTGQPNGFIVAGACSTGAITFGWPGMTERYDAQVEAFTHSGADSTATGTVTAAATLNTSASPVLAVAAFAPA